MSAEAIKAGGAEIEIGAKDKTNNVFKMLKGKMASIGTFASMAGGAVSKSFSNMGSTIGSFANNVGAKAFSGIKSAIGNLASGAAMLGKTMLGIGTAISGVGIASIMTLSKIGDKYDKMAMRTGETTERLSQLAFAADMSGTSIESLEGAMNKASRFMLQLETGTQESKLAMQKLGLTMGDLKGKSPTDMMLTFAEALQKVPDVAERNALTMQILGRSANELQPLFMAGADGMREMMAEADALGGTVSRSQADIGAGLNDAMGRISTATSGVFRKIGEKIGPIMIELMNNAAHIIAGIGPPIAEIGHKIIAIMSAVGQVFAPIFLSAKDSVLGTMSDMVDGIPALAFRMYRIYQETVTMISKLFLTMIAGIQTAFEQLMSGELLLKAQGAVADLLIDAQALAGIISAEDAEDIKKTRREDTERAMKNDPDIAASKKRQKDIADNLTDSLQTLGEGLDAKLRDIDSAEDAFNTAKDEALAQTFSLPDFNNMFNGLDLADQVATAVKISAPAALERGSLEAFKQGEENKKAMNPVVNAIVDVDNSINELTAMLNAKLEFEEV